jgi:hypothetical protein
MKVTNPRSKTASNSMPHTGLLQINGDVKEEMRLPASTTGSGFIFLCVVLAFVLILDVPDP